MKKLLFLLLLTFFYNASFAQPSIMWSFNTKDASFGQSAAGDIDGDGKLEIVFGCYRNDSSIYALNAENGTLLWKFNAAGVAEGCNDVAPIIYDVDGDGKLDVIVPSSCNPKTYCLDGKTGKVKWVCNTRGSDSPPTIADIDGDGKPEILHGEFGGYVICINGEDGSVAWEIAVDTDSWIQTAPTIVDLNNDGKLDFVVATWNAVNRNANKVYAYRASDQKLLWTYPLSDVVYHGTAVGDLDGDGKPELVIGSYNDTLYCINGENGTTKWKYSLGNNFAAAGPAVIADLDDDGQCEVVFSAWYKMTALDKNGKVKWQTDIPGYGGSFRGPAVADVNNDRYKDVIFGTNTGHLIGLNGNDGSIIFDKNLRLNPADSLFDIDHAPLVADFDKNGTMDAFIVGGHAEYPNFYKDYGKAYMVSIGKGKGPDWLMFQHDVRRRSNVCEKDKTGVEEVNFSESSSLNIYPNPSSGAVWIELQSQSIGVARLEVTNYTGQKIDDQKLKIDKGLNKVSWKAPKGSTAGIYFFKVRLEEGTAVGKVLMVKD
ncbi:MAG: FG-GAP-like repeat-containing protein [Chitinophagaceae bacterium]